MKLTIRDVSRLLDVTPRVIYKWIKEENLPAYRIKERYRFNHVDVLDWATSKKKPFRPELVQESDSGGSSTFSVSLEKALEAGGVHYNVPNHDKASVMRAVVHRLPLPADVDREFAAQVLLAREDLGSTAIGEGFAIPHARNPIVFHVDSPLLTLCFLEKPVDFDAIDGLPVHTIFALICPNINSHLGMLSQLAYALHNQIFKRLLKERASQEELLAKIRKIESRLPSLAAEKKKA
ncbi:MAG TPA: PTS sugar transporter subunit IIA [bacterium]|nr:PTS sugar transporter subunit IIA [bacterium]